MATVSVSKWEIVKIVIKLLIVVVPFMIVLAVKWADRELSGALSRLLNAMFRPKIHY
jgi:hypothetical protein